ncbi:MAG TPA: Na+/H+ antiporter [Chloroflexota bacterium]|nr:Na+/H+ antiporter [Chloroflexota bacterium]
MEPGAASAGVTILVWLLIAILVVAVFSKYVRVPYTVALVVAGLIIALTPLHLTIQLTPDLILFIFLPALLFESSFNLHFADLRDNLRPVAFLAVPGVILTAVFIAAAMHYALALDWPTAFLFGAIMSATDPISVLAIFRRVGAPRRLAVILEGESLFNDGTSLVIFAIVLQMVEAHQVADAVVTVEQFVVVVAGALALGAVIGYGASLLLSRVNDYLVETSMTLVVAYGSYLLAERIGVSGVIAVVVAALIVGNYGRNTAMSPTTRLAVSSTWEFISFLANSLIFILIGIELDLVKMGQYLGPTVLAIVVVLAVRAVVVVGSSWVLRYIHRPISFRWQIVLVWGGLRGALALAMALSLPLGISPSQPFPDRELLQVMTFGVIIFSLLGQGLTMGPLLRRLGMTDTSERQEQYEVLAARRGMALAAISQIGKLEASGSLGSDVAEGLRHVYSSQAEDLGESLRALRLRDEDIREQYVRAIRRRVIQSQKTYVQQRYLEGTLSEEGMRSITVDLDAELHELDLPGEPPEDGTEQGEPRETAQPERAEEARPASGTGS